MVSTKLSMAGWIGGRREVRKRRAFSISAQQEAQVEEVEGDKVKQEKKQEAKQPGVPPRPVETQSNVRSKNMSREYGGQWLSSTTRHVRIYAAYIDPVTFEFDQTQMDKLTLILDPSNEFVWTPDACYKVYSVFQELVDHYEVISSINTILYATFNHVFHWFKKYCFYKLK